MKKIFLILTILLTTITATGCGRIKETTIRESPNNEVKVEIVNLKKTILVNFGKKYAVDAQGDLASFLNKNELDENDIISIIPMTEDRGNSNYISILLKKNEKTLKILDINNYK